VKYLPLIIVVIVLFAAMTLTRRNRQRAMQAQTEKRESIRFGTDVMTTSGLYGTVVGLNDDETVQLAIAPGIEVKWALGALSDVASLKPPAGSPLDDEPADGAITEGHIEPTDPSSPSGS
jgi:preprotein translocase subunit YajC